MKRFTRVFNYFLNDSFCSAEFLSLSLSFESFPERLINNAFSPCLSPFSLLFLSLEHGLMRDSSLYDGLISSTVGFIPLTYPYEIIHAGRRHIVPRGPGRISGEHKTRDGEGRELRFGLTRERVTARAHDIHLFSSSCFRRLRHPS